jgi:hypothetical protein
MAASRLHDMVPAPLPVLTGGAGARSDVKGFAIATPSVQPRDS